MTGLEERIYDGLREHFVMWRDLTGDGPPGEWFCSCGLKFGFSDTAIRHVAGVLAAGRPELEELAEAAYLAAMGTRSDPTMPCEPWAHLPVYWRRIYRAQAAAVLGAVGIEASA